MIIVCELSFDDGAHVPFNAGLLATISAAFPNEKISFYGAVAHLEELKKEVGQEFADSISWNPIVPPAPGSLYRDRFFRELNILRDLLATGSRHPTSRLILTSAYPSTVLALKVARLFIYKRLPVQVVLHGLTGVVGKRYRHPNRRFQDMRTALTLLRNTQIQYLVLEESIRDTVIMNLSGLSHKVEALDHPISPAKMDFDEIKLNEPIRFGFLGLADKAKGFPLFLELANHVTEKFGHRAEFHVVGRFPCNGGEVDGIAALTTKPGYTFMSRDDFLKAVSSLHFVVLPHQAASYTLAASGILLDAIALEKPVIASKIPIFEAMFTKHGDIGYLFNNTAELLEIVSRIVIATDKFRYSRQMRNLRNAKSARAPKTLASSYLEMCRKLSEAAQDPSHRPPYQVCRP
jgi:glycosyltransferase involved in cell wall biosynthesis